MYFIIWYKDKNNIYKNKILTIFFKLIIFAFVVSMFCGCSILSKNTVSPYNEKAVAASKGAIFKIPVFFDELKTYFEDQKIIVTTLDNDSVSLKSINKPEKFVVVLGNEANGVSGKIVEKAHIKIKIDMDNIDSLNVAVAGGIVLYTLA